MIIYIERSITRWNTHLERGHPDLLFNAPPQTKNHMINQTKSMEFFLVSVREWFLVIQKKAGWHHHGIVWVSRVASNFYWFATWHQKNTSFWLSISSLIAMELWRKNSRVTTINERNLKRENHRSSLKLWTKHGISPKFPKSNWWRWAWREVLKRTIKYILNNTFFWLKFVKSQNLETTENNWLISWGIKMTKCHPSDVCLIHTKKLHPARTRTTRTGNTVNPCLPPTD